MQRGKKRGGGDYDEACGVEAPCGVSEPRGETRENEGEGKGVRGGECSSSERLLTKASPGLLFVAWKLIQRCESKFLF